MFRMRSDRASDEVARSQPVSLAEFPFAIRAKSDEWRDLQLVSQITFARLVQNQKQSNVSAFSSFSCVKRVKRPHVLTLC